VFLPGPLGLVDGDSLTISDTGTNNLRLVDGLTIVGATIASNTLLLNIETNGAPATVTILEVGDFVFQVGGGAEEEPEQELSYQEFVDQILDSTVPGDGEPPVTVDDEVVIGASGEPEFSISGDLVLAEGDAGATDFTFTVTRDGDTSGTDTVDYAVTGTGADPAEADDFVGDAFPSGTVTFEDGETEKTVTVQVAGDTVLEGDETFTVTLSNPSAGEVVDPTSADGTILNDDAPFTIDGPATVNEDGTATYTVTLGAPASEETTVTFQLVAEGDVDEDAGTGLANLDDFAVGAFNPVVKTIGVGETTATFTVSPIDDGLVELPEGYSVQATVNDVAASAATTILDGVAAGEFVLDDMTSSTPILTPPLALNTANTTEITVGNDTFGGGFDTTPGADGEATIRGRPDALDTLRLIGDASIEFDLTDAQEQLEKIDINGDGVFTPGTDENDVRPKVDVQFWDFLDAHPRLEDLNGDGDFGDVGENGLLDPTNTELGYTGDITFSGTSGAAFSDDNIVLGGWGDDLVLAGVGVDFLSGGGGENTLSGGQGSDFFVLELTTDDIDESGATDIKGGSTFEDGGEPDQDADWLLLEASDDQEPITVKLTDVDIDSDADPGGVGTENPPPVDEPLIGASAFLEDIEHINASGNFYRFLDVESGGGISGDPNVLEIGVGPGGFTQDDLWGRVTNITVELSDGSTLNVGAGDGLPVGDPPGFAGVLSLVESVFEQLPGITIEAVSDVVNGIPRDIIRITDANFEQRDFADNDQDGNFFTLEGLADPITDEALTGFFRFDFPQLETGALFEELYFGDFRDFSDNPEAQLFRVENLSPGVNGQMNVMGSDERNVIIAGYDDDVVMGMGGDDLLAGGDLEFLLTHRNNANEFDPFDGTIASGDPSDGVADIGTDVLSGDAGDDDLVWQANAGSAYYGGNKPEFAPDGTGYEETMEDGMETVSFGGIGEVQRIVIDNFIPEGVVSLNIAGEVIEVDAPAGFGSNGSDAVVANRIAAEIIDRFFDDEDSPVAGFEAFLGTDSSPSFVDIFFDEEAGDVADIIPVFPPSNGSGDFVDVKTFVQGEEPLDVKIFNGGEDTLWLTPFSVGRSEDLFLGTTDGSEDSRFRQPGVSFDPNGAAEAGDEAAALAALVEEAEIRSFTGPDRTDDNAHRVVTENEVIRLDLGVGRGVNYQGYGGADEVAADDDLTADQTNYDSGFDRSIVRSIENVNASGLNHRGEGDGIDYFAIGPNETDLNFENHQNYRGSNSDLDLRGVDTAGAGQIIDEDQGFTAPLDNINDGNYADTQLTADINLGNAPTEDGPAIPSLITFSDLSELSTFAKSTDRFAPEQNQLIGGEGDDVLEGRGGDDRLSGRGGNDTFIVSTNDGDNLVDEKFFEELDIVDRVGYPAFDNEKHPWLPGSSELNGLDSMEKPSDLEQFGYFDPDNSVEGLDKRLVDTAFGDNINFISRDVDAVGEDGGSGSDGFVDIDTDDNDEDGDTGEVLIERDFRPPLGIEATESKVIFDPIEEVEDTTGYNIPGFPDDYSNFVGTLTVTIDGVPIPVQLQAAPDAATVADLLQQEINSLAGTFPQLSDVVVDEISDIPNTPPPPESDGDPVGIGGVDDNDRVQITFPFELAPGSIQAEFVPQPVDAVGFAVTFEPGEPFEVIEDDDLVFRSYQNRIDGESTPDQQASLGLEAYAEDLVYSFETGSTQLVEGQEYRILIEDLKDNDVVSLTVNGKTFSLEVDLEDVDGPDIAGIETDQFLEEFANYINAQIAMDPHSRAGSLHVFTNPNVDGDGNGNIGELVIREWTNPADKAEHVFMSFPEVEIENLSGGDAPTYVVKDTSDTEVVLYDYDGSPDVEGLNRGVGPTVDRGPSQDDRYITFEDITGENRSVIQTAATDGDNDESVDGLEALMGLDVIAFDVDDLDEGDFVEVPLSNDDAAIGPSLDDEDNNEIGQPVIENFAALHGDDLLIGSDANDEIQGKTGDDRIIGSQTAGPLGVDTVDGGLNIVVDSDGVVQKNPDGSLVQQPGSGETLLKFKDTLIFDQREFTSIANFNIVLAAFSASFANGNYLDGGLSGLVNVDDDPTPGDTDVDHSTVFDNVELVRTLNNNPMNGEEGDRLDMSDLSDSLAEGSHKAGVRYDNTMNLGAITADDNDDGDITSADYIEGYVQGAETVIGGLGDDTLLGGPADESLVGGGGDDFIDGGDGADELLGEGGNDTLTGGDVTDTFTDTLTGGDGSDTFVHGGAIDGLDVITDFAGDEDDDGNLDADEDFLDLDAVSANASDFTVNEAGTLFVLAAEDRDITADDVDEDARIGYDFTPDPIDDEVINNFTSNIDIGGQGLIDIYQANRGNFFDNPDDSNQDDLIVAFGASNQFLVGGSGDDRILDFGGANIIFGDGGAGYFLGPVIADLDHDGDFFDTPGGAADVDGSGNDTIYAGDGNDEVYGGSGDDLIDGGDGEDDLFGELGADTISGGAQDDFISGGSGGDDLFGDEGDDELVGGSGSDNLDGGAGEDTLDGGDDGFSSHSRDVLTGGEDADTFLFRDFFTADVVTDFETGVDEIHLVGTGVVSTAATTTMVLVGTSMPTANSTVTVSTTRTNFDLDLSDFTFVGNNGATMTFPFADSALPANFLLGGTSDTFGEAQADFVDNAADAIEDNFVMATGMDGSVDVRTGNGTMVTIEVMWTGTDFMATVDRFALGGLAQTSSGDLKFFGFINAPDMYTGSANTSTVVEKFTLGGNRTDTGTSMVMNSQTWTTTTFTSTPVGNTTITNTKIVAPGLTTPQSVSEVVAFGPAQTITTTMTVPTFSFNTTTSTFTATTTTENYSARTNVSLMIAELGTNYDASDIFLV
jgi:Ca2+-binding RTX toxin-like protein